MDYELIPDEVYDNLPAESHQKFVKLVRTAQASVGRLVDDDSSGHFVEEIRLQFMETVRAIADSLDIQGLPTQTETQNLNSYEEYRFFSTRLAGAIAKARLTPSYTPQPHSVELGRITKARIRQEAEQLRSYIQNSDLDSKNKKSVTAQLDLLLKELEKQRLSFAQVTAIAAAIATTLNQGASAIEKLPDAYRTLVSIFAGIGSDKEKEEAERERLAPPAKQLPPPVKATETVVANPSSYEDLDDIPF